MKDCTGRKGGRIAFAPVNQVTLELEKLFRDYFSDDIVFFENNKAIDDYLLQPGYTSTFDNGTRKQLCLAVTFNKYEQRNYEYNLRFNLSGPA